MTAARFRIKPLQDEDRAGFDCGEPEIDAYFFRRIGQDIRRRIAKAFVAIDGNDGRIAGFYTLSATSIALTALDDDWRRKLPRYPTVPAVLVGRLAVDRRFHGIWLGAALLADAALRAVSADIGTHLLVVEAKNEPAARFYAHHGLRRAPENDRLLFMPLAKLAAPLAGAS